MRTNDGRDSALAVRILHNASEQIQELLALVCFVDELLAVGNFLCNIAVEVRSSIAKQSRLDIC